MAKVIPMFPKADESSKEISPANEFYQSLSELQRIDYDAMGIRWNTFERSLSEDQLAKYHKMIEIEGDL